MIANHRPGGARKMGAPRVQRLAAITAILAFVLPACTSDGGGGTDVVPVASVVVTPPQSTIPALLTVQLTASVRDASGGVLTGKQVTWTSSSTSVATVSTNGLVTGVAEGTATITATSEGVGGTAQVVVTAAGVASVDVQPSAESVIVGGTVQLTATPRDAAGGSLTGRTVTWSSSDDAIATVDGNGLVATAAVGEATITATSEGTSGSATITVLPVPVASVTVTPNPAQTQVAGTVQLTAELKDADDNVLDAAGRTITWSSSDDAVATVDDAGEVTGVALGMATITATAEGQSGTADVDVIPDNFSPGADTNISGTQDFNEVNIPAGVTVTVTDDLVMNVAGDVTIDGTLSGDCVGIAINGEGNVTIRGDVMNGCDDGVTDLPDMSIVGDGDLTLDGGTIEYAGNLELSNDPTLDDSAFPAPGVPSGLDYYRAADASQAGDCRAFTHAFVPKPPKMAPGADGIVGGPGTDAKTWVLRCRGNAFIDGNVKVFGQDGGDGGKGTHEGALSANATGGPGGKGGKIRILVTGNLTFSGAGNEVVSGDGGAGGAALARGFFDVNPDPAWGATATGGAGAEPGLVDIRSTGGFIAIPGELTVRVGTGGAGGASDAFGGQGAHADERAAKPAQIGGDATAIGGLGGSSLQLKLQASGSVSGRANVDVEGGDGGKGGSTNADAGDGGDGNELFIDGAAGGILDATGGFGGDGLIRDLDDMPVSLGGDGGDLFVGGANGGFGWVDCIPPTFKKGGEGGPGGIVNGQRSVPTSSPVFQASPVRCAPRAPRAFSSTRSRAPRESCRRGHTSWTSSTT